MVPTRPADTAVALVAALGSGSVGIPTTAGSTTLGPKGSGLAKVSCCKMGCYTTGYGAPHINENDCLAGYHARSSLYSHSPLVGTSMTMCLQHSPTEARTGTSLSTVNSGSDGCSECGTTKKSGRRSRCARGGTWFRNCGDAGDGQFGHTWKEGIQACTGCVSPISGQPSLEVTLRQVDAIAYLLSTVRTHNATYQRTNIFHPARVSNAGTSDSKDRVGLAIITACMCVLLAN